MYSDRVIRECHHAEANHRHGTSLAYKLDRCRCVPCNDANVLEAALRRRAKAYGRYDNGRVDATATREHLRVLLAAGFTLHAIRGIAKVNRSILERVLDGQPRVLQTTETKILAIRPDLILYAPDHMYVDALGTSRRLQALVAIGYSPAMLEARLPSIYFGRALSNEGRISAGFARHVRAVYDELWGYPREGKEAEKARKLAIDNLWAPPLSWDDDTIDNPRAVPQGLPGERGRTMSIESIEELIRNGTSVTEIVRRARYLSADSLHRRLRRANRTDLLEKIAGSRSF